MNNKVLTVVAVIIMIGAAVGIVFAFENGKHTGEVIIENTDGTTTKISHVADKVVLLNVNTVEAAIMLGATDKIVGVGSAALKRADCKAMIPEAVDVGSSTSPNVDKVDALHPDLIVGFSTMKIKNQAELEALGYPVAYLDCYIPGQMEKDLKNLAKALGKRAAVDRYIEFVDGKVEEIKSKLPSSGLADKRFYVEFSGTTYTTGYPSQNAGTSSDVILGNLGFTNVTHDVAYGAYVQADVISGSNASVIVKIYDISGNIDAVKSELNSRVAFDGLPAKTNGDMYMMYANIAYGLRCFSAYAMFAKMAFPTEFADLDVEQWLKDYNTEFDLNFYTNYSFVKVAAA